VAEPLTNREPWKCEGCGWTNIDYVRECDGCGEPISTALISRDGALADLAERAAECVRLTEEHAEFKQAAAEALRREVNRGHHLAAEVARYRTTLEAYEAFDDVIAALSDARRAEYTALIDARAALAGGNTP
jgi:hypothetical protein